MAEDGARACAAAIIRPAYVTGDDAGRLAGQIKSRRVEVDRAAGIIRAYRDREVAEALAEQAKRYGEVISHRETQRNAAEARVAEQAGEIERLKVALEITKDALRWYEADPDVVGAENVRWEYDYDQRRWYFKHPYPSDVADFALRKAGLAERGEGPPFEDYVGKAKTAALGAASGRTKEATE